MNFSPGNLGGRSSEVRSNTAFSSQFLRPLSSSALTRWTVYIYIHLWMIEGAVRKWVPGTSSVFYALRDVVAVAMLAFAAIAIKHRSSSRAVSLEIGAAVFTAVVLWQSLLGSQTAAVTALGLKSYLGTLIFVYIIVKYRPVEVLYPISRMLIWYAFPEVVLSVVQVLSPPDSPMNKIVGGDEAAFVNGNVARISGTFSAVAGMQHFITIALAIVLWSFHWQYRRNRITSTLALGSILVMVVISGQRALVLSSIVTLGLYFAYIAWRFGARSILAVTVGVGAVAGAAAITLQLLPQIYQSFSERFTSASAEEDPLQRILSQTFGFIFDGSFHMLGDGIGSHSQVGIAAGSPFPWIEIESLKWLAELGLVGYLMAWARLLLVAVMLWISLRRRSLALVLIASAVSPFILWGALTQYPTAQGGISLGIGLFVLIMQSENQSYDEEVVLSS